MGIFPEGPPYVPGMLTLRGIIDGKVVDRPQARNDVGVG